MAIPLRRISRMKPSGTARDTCVKCTFTLLSFKATPSVNTIPAIKRQESRLQLRRFGFGPEGLRKFFDLFGFFHDVDGKELRGPSFL